MSVVKKGREVPDALPLEYKQKYGYATGQAKLSDILNYPPLESEFRRLGLVSREEFSRFILKDGGMFEDGGSDNS